MNPPQRLAVEFSLDATPNLTDFIPLFHRWIKEQRLADHLLVDVADYRHILTEPSVMLIGYQADVIVSWGGKRAVVGYLRKRGWPAVAGDSFAESLYRRVASTLSGALEAVAALGGEGIAVSRTPFTLRILDRLAALSEPELARAWRQSLRAALTAFFVTDDIQLKLLRQDARRAFAVRVRLRGALEDVTA